MNHQNANVATNEGKVSIKSCNDQQLLAQFQFLVKTERKITYEILRFIIELEHRRLPALLGFPSTHMYLVKEHGYSEAAAQRRIQSARLLNECPEIANDIRDGRINMTQLHQAQTSIRQKENDSHENVGREQKLELLSAIVCKSTLETGKVLAQALDMPVKALDTIRAQKDESFYIGTQVSKAQMEKIESVKSLFSQSLHNPSLADLIEFLCDFAISKKSPNRSVRKRAVKTESSVSRLPENSPAENSKAEIPHQFTSLAAAAPTPMTQLHAVTECSRHIPSPIRRVILAANPCCQYVSALTGRACESRFQLQVDHIIPYSISHDHSLANLRVLCRAHNLSESLRWGFAIPESQKSVEH